MGEGRSSGVVVWMVHARTGLHGLKGTLSLLDDLLLFHPETTRAGDTEIPYSAIRRVRRVRGSPVMEVELDAAGSPPIVGFYFVKPPSLERPADASPWVGGRTIRKRALRTLRGANKSKKPEIQGWVAEVKDRMGR